MPLEYILRDTLDFGHPRILFTFVHLSLKTLDDVKSANLIILQPFTYMHIALPSNY